MQVIGKNKTKIEYGQFLGRKDIVEIEIAQSVKRLEHSAFRNCIFLETVILPFNLESLGAYCFAGCTRLKRIYMPSRMMKFEYTAFRQCKSLCQLIIMDKTKPAGDTYDTRLFQVPRCDEYMRWLYIEAAMCFYEIGIGMGQYDDLFPRLDELDDRYAIAVFRLRDKFQMNTAKIAEYEAAVRSYMPTLIEEDDVEGLTAASDLDCIREAGIDDLIERAVKKRGACTAYLLEYKNTKLKRKEQDFSL